MNINRKYTPFSSQVRQSILLQATKPLWVPKLDRLGKQRLKELTGDWNVVFPAHYNSVQTQKLLKFLEREIKRSNAVRMLEVLGIHGFRDHAENIAKLISRVWDGYDPTEEDVAFAFGLIPEKQADTIKKITKWLKEKLHTTLLQMPHFSLIDDILDKANDIYNKLEEAIQQMPPQRLQNMREEPKDGWRLVREVFDYQDLEPVWRRVAAAIAYALLMKQ